MVNYGFAGEQRFGSRTASFNAVENLSYWMNVSFLEQGAYTNINKDQVDYYGNNVSELVQINDSSWIDGGVYQSRFKNWVYENGVNSPSDMDNPVICSGIWIGDDFHSKEAASGDLQFTIDYVNGRVKFFTAYGPDYAYGSGTVVGDNPIPIKAEFSYKDVYVVSDSDTPDEGVVVQSMSNPIGSGISYPTESDVPFPAIVIGEKNSRWKGKQLGGFKIGIHSIYCNIYTDNKTQRDGLCDILSQQQNKRIPTINWTLSETPLDEYGDINTAFSGVYEAKTVYPWKNMYINVATASKDYDKFKEGVVFYEIETDSYI